MKEKKFNVFSFFSFKQCCADCQTVTASGAVHYVTMRQTEKCECMVDEEVCILNPTLIFIQI